MDVVVIDRLSKNYGATRALNATSWTLQRGERLGFLGPNGAGKTTTIRILLGFLKSTAGRASVFGLDAWRGSTAIRRRVGYLSGDVRLYKHLTGLQTVRFVGGVRRMRRIDEAHRLAEVLDLDLSTQVRSYSRGMRQKLGLITALMHRPELLILDEPTSGLDPLMQQVLYRELRAATDEGRTVLFSSHSLAEVESLCEEVIILRAGEVVESASVSDLRARARQRVLIRLANEASELPPYPAGLQVVRRRNATLEGAWQGRSADLLQWLAALPTEEVVIEPPNLEEVFLSYYSAEGESDG